MSAPLGPAHPRPVPPSLGGATLLVAGREISTQLRSKAFLISSALLLLAVLAGIVASSVLADRVQEAVPVAAPASVAAQVEDLPGIRMVEVADDDAAIAAVRDGSVKAAVLPGTGPTLRLVALQSAPQAVVDALTVRPEVEVLEPARAGDGAVRYVVSLAFGLVFMMAAITFGSTIAKNTVTEKQTRVVEILLSAVPVRALLAGKVLGNSVLAL
ncbi:MAG: ABC transporter permease subunit, partial [Actinobacteria bacterium]|nr:ABC transporter permease subunit [Actinomycetota bacterium]